MAGAQRRVAAHDDERAVLVHGDVHQWNALRAGDGFELVDPDGLLAEPEYDLGVLMRADPVERVSTGLLCTRIGLQPVGREMLTAADHVAEA